MRIAKEIFASKKAAIMNFGLLLGVGVAITGTAAPLFLAYWAFNVSAASLLSVTGATAFLLGPIGLGVALGVGLAALIGSLLYLHFHNQKALPEINSFDIYGDKQQKAKKSGKLDVTVSIASGFVSVAASVAVGVVAALGFLSPVGFILALLAAALISVIPFVKLGVDARAGSAPMVPVVEWGPKAGGRMSLSGSFASWDKEARPVPNATPRVARRSSVDSLWAAAQGDNLSRSGNRLQQGASGVEAHELSIEDLTGYSHRKSLVAGPITGYRQRELPVDPYEQQRLSFCR